VVVIVWLLDLQLPVQSVHITVHGGVYSIQHYMIKFVSDLRQVCGFLRVLLYPPPIKLTTTIYNAAKILLTVALNTITITLNLNAT
jgi:hypothetical protein